MEIKTITINGLPLTKTVFEQIPEVDVLMFASKQLTVLGYVSYMPSKRAYIVGFSPAHGLVVTPFINPDVLKKAILAHVLRNGFYSSGSDSSTLFRLPNSDYSLDLAPFVPFAFRQALNTVLRGNYSSHDREGQAEAALVDVFSLLDSFKTSIDKIEQIFYT